MEEFIWVSESDVCEDCGELLDALGGCPNCGWGELDDIYEDDPDPDCVDFDEFGHYIGG